MKQNNNITKIRSKLELYDLSDFLNNFKQQKELNENKVIYLNSNLVNKDKDIIGNNVENRPINDNNIFFRNNNKLNNIEFKKDLTFYDIKKLNNEFSKNGSKTSNVNNFNLFNNKDSNNIGLYFSKKYRYNYLDSSITKNNFKDNNTNVDGLNIDVYLKKSITESKRHNKEVANNCFINYAKQNSSYLHFTGHKVEFDENQIKKLDNIYKLHNAHVSSKNNKIKIFENIEKEVFNNPMASSSELMYNCYLKTDDNYNEYLKGIKITNINYKNINVNNDLNNSSYHINENKNILSIYPENKI